MKTYKITKGNKQYVIKAKDNYSAVAKLQTFLKDQKQVAKFTKFNNGDVAEGFIMETNKGFLHLHLLKIQKTIKIFQLKN